jgi:hypothetical protein
MSSRDIINLAAWVERTEPSAATTVERRGEMIAVRAGSRRRRSRRSLNHASIAPNIAASRATS